LITPNNSRMLRLSLIHIFQPMFLPHLPEWALTTQPDRLIQFSDIHPHNPKVPTAVYSTVCLTINSLSLRDLRLISLEAKATPKPRAAATTTTTSTHQVRLVVVVSGVKTAGVDRQGVGAAEGAAPTSTRIQTAKLWQLGYQVPRRYRIDFRKCRQAFIFHGAFPQDRFLYPS